jgi:hypothetical protein
MTEMTEQATEVTRCRTRSKTDNPCPFVATETIEHYSAIDEGPHVCAYHAADAPLYDEIDEYGLALEKMEAYAKGARKNNNCVLVKDLERLQAEYRERLEWLEDLADRLEAANRDVAVYTGE